MEVVLTQTTVDTVRITRYGPLSVCEFTWAAAHPPAKSAVARASTKLVSSAQLARVRRRKTDSPVSDVFALRGLGLLTDDGVVALSSEAGAFFFESMMSPSEHGTLIVFDGEQLHAELAAHDVETLAARAVEVDFSNHGLWAFDASDEDGPMRIPQRFEISNRYVRIDEAAASLAEHELVLAVERQGGRPGSYDHVPASLMVTVLFDEQAWKQLCEYARFQGDRYRRPGERPTCPSGGLVSQACTWSLNDAEPKVNDVLGLARFRRVEEYREPDELDW